MYFQGIQNFGGSVLNPNKKAKEFDDINALSSTVGTSGNQQLMPAEGPQDHLTGSGSVSPNISRSASGNAIQQDYMATKISDSPSCTQVLLL